MGDAAKHAALLIALGGPKGKGAIGDEPGGPKGDGPKGDDVESAAVDDMFDAIKARDRASFGEALKRYVQSCIAKSGDDDEEPEPSSGDHDYEE
jgi:hypothetical protein